MNGCGLILVKNMCKFITMGECGLNLEKIDGSGCSRWVRVGSSVSEWLRVSGGAI